MNRTAVYHSPVGPLLLCSDGSAVTGLYTQAHSLPDGTPAADCPVLQEAARWLDSYFRGRPAALPPVRPKGTPFQLAVWDCLLDIPYGDVRTYGQIAKVLCQRLNKSRMSAQAVGQAVGANPISIMIPCHRVIGADGSLTGYAGGLSRKQWLLEHEGRL